MIKPITRVLLTVKPGKQMVDTSDLSGVISNLRGISEEIRLLNPRRHPPKEEVLNRWASTLNEACEIIGGEDQGTEDAHNPGS